MLGTVRGRSGRLGVGLEFTARGKGTARGTGAARPVFFVVAKATTHKELSLACVM